MKKCPTCQKTFEDNLKFCQTDGTALIEDALPPDPYQTVVIKPEDIGAPIPLEPITPSTKAENVDDVLDIPDEPDEVEVEEYDPMKTMITSGAPLEADDDPMKTAYVSEAERREIFGEKPETNAPPSPFDSNPAETSSTSPTPPKFDELDLSPPSFGDLESSSSEPPEEKTPLPKSPPPPQTFEPPKTPSIPPNIPIPSPFDKSMPPGYQTPSSPPFQEPEEKPKMNEPSSPFGGSSFDSAPKPANQNIQQSNKPNQEQKNMQNQQYNQQPAREGQNKTLATVSLVSSILGFVCLGLIGSIVGIVTGFMARKKVAENPTEYGGEGLAKIGFILGIVGVVFNILVIIITIIVLVTNPNLLK